MNNNKRNSIVNKDIYTTKSDYAPVENMKGYKILSNQRGCQPFPYEGSLLNNTKVGHMEVKNFGFPQYSDFNKCNSIAKNSIDNINKEVLKNNINVNDIFEMKYQQKKNLTSRKNANLGENVLSYRIINNKK
jgi:hypothetical protein